MRTIGVLTKMDLVDAANGAALLNVSSAYSENSE